MEIYALYALVCLAQGRLLSGAADKAIDPLEKAAKLVAKLKLPPAAPRKTRAIQHLVGQGFVGLEARPTSRVANGKKVAVVP